MTIIDHLLFFGLAAVYPAMASHTFRKLRMRIAAGEAISPTELYRSTMIGHWTLFLVGIGVWLLAGRAWQDLGFSLDVDTGFLAGLALTAAAVVTLVRYYGQLDGTNEKIREALRRELGDLDILMPRNNRELRFFYALSATAGIVEEMLWRGYLFWYLGHFMPVWAAAIVSSLLFGLGHIYQGVASVPKVSLVGGIFAGLYLLTGSLWLPMLLHAVFDAVQGRAVYTLLSRQPTFTGEPAVDESA